MEDVKSRLEKVIESVMTSYQIIYSESDAAENNLQKKKKDPQGPLINNV